MNNMTDLKCLIQEQLQKKRCIVFPNVNIKRRESRNTVDRFFFSFFIFDFKEPLNN